jgi:hypothetical protein
MGINVYCGLKSFNCRYNAWNSIRINIIKSTFDYIKDKFNKDKELYENIEDEEDENWIGEDSNYKVYMDELIDFIDECIKHKNDNFLEYFVEYCPLNPLYFFDISGLFYLCNQSDCDGFYSPGNSLDICILFDKIKTFTNKYDIYNCIYDDKFNEEYFNNSIYTIFDESYKNRQNVCIS